MPPIHIPESLQTKYTWTIGRFNGSDKDIYINGGEIKVDYDDVNHIEARQIARAIVSIPILLEAIQTAIDLIDARDAPDVAVDVLRDALEAATKPLEETR